MENQGQLPTDDYFLIVNTWSFVGATEEAYNVKQQGGSTLDALERGLGYCEIHQCDGTVGFGGSPDENGETTLDAMIMDGSSMNVGSVAGLRRIKNAIGVARKVLEHTSHSMLVGNQALEFAKQMGFVEEELNSTTSTQLHNSWKLNNCQPNFWKDVEPDSNIECGPYKPSIKHKENSGQVIFSKSETVNENNHDTISMIIRDNSGNLFAGTSTNGARNKIPGRVGDGPIIGSGSYSTNMGACGSTGDGDILMRFLPCYQAVENIRLGMSLKESAENALIRIGKIFPDYKGSLIVVSKDGRHSGASYNWNFTYSVRDSRKNEVEIVNILPIKI